MDKSKFIQAWLQDVRPGFLTMSELCVRSGVSRKSGYQLLKRFQEEGDAAFLPRSPKPHTHPKALAEKQVNTVVDVRRLHPTWGPKKVRAYLMKNTDMANVPAASTIGTLLQQAGLVVHRRKRRLAPVVYPGILGEFTAPNAIWCVDFKGQFRLGDGSYCFPLTITDGYSRYLLRCQGLRSTNIALSRPVFEAAFREFGLPLMIRSDNGVPFATMGLGGLSTLSVWFLTLGIRLERISPGCPQQNGRHERMHKTLKAEATKPSEMNIRLQQQGFDSFQLEFNNVRPHEALGQETPASVYTPSSRLYPCAMVPQRLEEGEEFRQVNAAGDISLRKKKIYLGTALSGQRVRVGMATGERHTLWFYEVFLGEYQETAARVLLPTELKPPTPELESTVPDIKGITDINIKIPEQ